MSGKKQLESGLDLDSMKKSFLDETTVRGMVDYFENEFDVTHNGDKKHGWIFKLKPKDMPPSEETVKLNGQLKAVNKEYKKNAVIFLRESICEILGKETNLIEHKNYLKIPNLTAKKMVCEKIPVSETSETKRVAIHNIYSQFSQKVHNSKKECTIL